MAAPNLPLLPTAGRLPGSTPKSSRFPFENRKNNDRGPHFLKPRYPQVSKRPRGAEGGRLLDIPSRSLIKSALALSSAKGVFAR